MSIWMQTLHGAVFEPENIDPSMIDIRDIAGALSKQCRYGGHCLKFYSVAEHCVHMAREAPIEVALEALMHDSAETYLVDIPRAVKNLMRDYKPLERKLEAAIAQRFGLQYDSSKTWGWPPEVQVLDEQMLANEKEQNMSPAPRDWQLRHTAIPNLKLRFWEPRRAEAEFLSAFHHYSAMR